MSKLYSVQCKNVDPATAAACKEIIYFSLEADVLVSMGEDSRSIRADENNTGVPTDALIDVSAKVIVLTLKCALGHIHNYAFKT